MSVLWNYFRRVFNNHEFIVEFQNGTARATKGKIMSRMLHEFSDLASRSGISKGSICGERGPGIVRLTFSKEIPASVHQQFRNIWSQFS
ncbi:MAG TPA: DUF3634 family protein [Verrucomicrobiales bacterium]|jgi:hypothetical protein|nr:DUF3634 family protein [Verrucomicrobiales bacterium]